MNEKELPPNERIAFLEQENARLKKSHAEEIARLQQQIARLQKQNPSFSTKTREDRLNKQSGV
jgi:uncharacterized small protein (DUF1192 family)